MASKSTTRPPTSGLRPKGMRTKQRGGALAGISHTPPAAKPESGLSASLRSVALLDVRSSTPRRAPVARLASKPLSGFSPTEACEKCRLPNVDLRLPGAEPGDVPVVLGHEDIVRLAAVGVGEVIVIRRAGRVDELRRAFLLLRIEVERQALVEALQLRRRLGRLAVARPDDAGRLRLRAPLPHRHLLLADARAMHHPARGEGRRCDAK